MIINEFGSTFQPKLDRQKIMWLFDWTLIRQNGNILFLGTTGVGKTHLAMSLALKDCEAGSSIYLTFKRPLTDVALV